MKKIDIMTKYFKSLTIRDLSTWIYNEYSKPLPRHVWQTAEKGLFIMRANKILRGKKKYAEAKNSAFIKKCLY